MEALVGTLIGVVVAQAGLVWYRLGRLEQKLTDLCREVRDGNNKHQED